jgi:hypothetical protein
MNLSRNVSEIIRKHLTLEVESIDRMYLNVYQRNCSGTWRWLVSFAIIAVNSLPPRS